MKTIEKIRQKIEELYDGEAPAHAQQCDFDDGYFTGIGAISKFIDSLESEKPMNPDAAMKELDEKIALVKQRGTWDGVDVDKYMDEVRGREPENPMELEEDFRRGMREWVELMVAASFPEQDNDFISEEDYRSVIKQTACHFAQWGAEHAKKDEIPVPADLEEAAWDCVLDSVDVNNPVLLPKYKELLTYLFVAGAKWQKQHDAELIEIAYNDGITIGMTKQKEQMMKEAIGGNAYPNDGEIWIDLARYGYKFKEGEPCRIIIVKEEEK